MSKRYISWFDFSILRDMIANMKRRVFIAINLPEGLKKRLKQYREKFEYLPRATPTGEVLRGLPVCWTKAPSLHLTLVFIGYVSDEQMLEICRVTKEAAAKFEPFFINFRRIVLGPPGKAPRMIWLEGEASQELTEFKKELEAALIDCDSGFYRAENRPFKPHITLARVKAGRWREANINQADIEQNLDAQVEVGGIDVMESDLKSDGAEYAVLKACPLKM